MAVTAPGLPVPVFVATGAGAWGPVQELRARPELRLVASPRHAATLLVAGRIAGDHVGALRRVHDQMPRPRTAVAWTGTAVRAAGTDAEDAVVRGGSDEVTAALVEAFWRVWRDPATSTPDRLPDEEPNEWRGVGPFGQGGEGMMGGTPYGRPMAMTGDDRDGLALDQLDLRLGPFLEWLPPGACLDVTLQGDVVQDVTPRLAPPSADDLGAPLPAGAPRPERDGLRWLALALHVHGLDALAMRAAHLAATAPSGAHDRRDDTSHERSRLCRSVRRSGLLWSVRGVGRIEGLGDAAERWRARLAQIDHAGEGTGAGAGGRAELAWSDLAGPLRGMTLTDVVTTVVSLHDRLVEPVGQAAAS